MIHNSQKLYGLPTVNYISFEQDVERRFKLEKELIAFNLPFISNISTVEEDVNSIINGRYLNQLDKRGIYCLMSHLRAIKKWYNESDEKYGFFIEDDFSFDTVNYWKFNWLEFFNSIEEKWDCLQLTVIKENPKQIEFKLKYRKWDDWSVTSYVITREYGRYLIDRFYKNKEFSIFLKNDTLIPIVENVIFIEGKTLSFPLFIEDINSITTTFKRNNDNIDVKARNYNQLFHNKSSEHTLNYWKNNNIEF